MPFQIIRNDITKMHVDAIVNTASHMPGYGAGIDSAVYAAAGKEKLLAKRYEIGVIDRGTSVITAGYDLPAKYIIHTVGTAWVGGNSNAEDIVRKCYRSIFKLALDNNIESLAIPLLASGSYGCPKGIALRIALTEIEAFIFENDIDVYLVVFDEKSVLLSSELYGDIDEYINDNYVYEKNIKEYRDPYLIRGRQGEDRSAYDSNSRADKFLGFLRPSSRSGKNLKSESDDRTYESTLSERKEELSSDMYVGKTSVSAQRTLEDVVKDLDKTFMELVFSFADAKGLTDVEVQKRANMDRKAFSKLKCGTTKNPSKSTALAMAIALELDLDDTKDLLSRAGLALSPCSKQDVIVQYFIERKVYNIYDINVALFEHGEQLLGMKTA